VSILKRNIFANFGGQAVATVTALVAVPLYVKFLGPEGYGLVSFFLTLQALVGILDFGLSTTANREVSRYLAQDRDAAARRTLVRTLEWYYYATGAFLFVLVAFATPFLSTSWFETRELDVATLRTCLLIAAASIALRWPASLYQGILRGAEQQVTLNYVLSLAVTLRGFGTILVLLFIARDVVVFYWWQLLFSLTELVLCVVAVSWRGMGFTGWGGRFDGSVLRGLWAFSLKVGGLSVFALILKQLDKIVISKLLPISSLGFYNAASLAGTGISKVGYPVQTAVFPRLTQLYERKDAPALADTFHRSTQLIAFLSVPCACVLLFFPHDVLWLWTRNADLATQASPALAILAAAMMLNSMMSVVFSLQLAAGLTWLPLYTNALGAIVLAPTTFILVRAQGITGGAYAWLIFNVMYFLAVPPILFRYVLTEGGHYRTFLLRDTLPFMVAGVTCFGLASWAATGASLVTRVTLAAAALLAYTGSTLGFNTRLRHALLQSPHLARLWARAE
jgi:O-antigen/teichoic acid export membrane protein